MSCSACLDIPEKAKAQINARIATLRPGGEGASIMLRLDVIVGRDGKLHVVGKVDPDEKYRVERQFEVDADVG